MEEEVGDIFYIPDPSRNATQPLKSTQTELLKKSKWEINLSHRFTIPKTYFRSRVFYQDHGRSETKRFAKFNFIVF